MHLASITGRLRGAAPVAAILALSLMVLPAPLAARTAACLITIDGIELLRGPCALARTNGPGSFRIMTPDSSLLIDIILTASGEAEGWWNGPDHGDRAKWPLGALTDADDCWENERARLCAW